MIDVDRPAQAPASLARKKSYSGKDVLAALYEAFLGKCYLCETTVEMGAFDVDHRRPKADDQFPEAEFDWRNLFPACAKHRCNQRREKRYPAGGLLDPAGGDRVEERVVQKLEGVVSVSLSGSAGFLFLAAEPLDMAAVNTASELDRIHNGRTLQAGSLRSAITEHVFAVATVVMDYRELLHAQEAVDRTRLEETRHRVRTLVSRRAPYTMLVRSYFARYDFVRVLFD